MKKNIFILIFILLLFLSYSCQSNSTDAVDNTLPENTVIPEQIHIVTDAPTEIPTDTPTPVPTPTSTPTSTPTPTPTPTPSPTPKGLIGGKYDVFSYEEDPIFDESKYISEKVSIQITEYDENPYHNAKLVYFVADIYLQNLTALRTAAARSFAKSNTASISKISSSNNALVAINGDYYSHGKGLLIRNGEVYRTKAAQNRDICILYKDGTMQTFTSKEYNSKMDLSTVWQAWQFGPYLIEDDGTPRKNFNGYGINPLNPRTVLGYYEPGHYCFVIVEGRRGKSYSAGLTLRDLAQLMVDLGCSKAYNMDGGGSTQLYWNNEIFNKPSGTSLRPIPDIVYISEPYPEDESDLILYTPLPVIEEPEEKSNEEDNDPAFSEDSASDSIEEVTDLNSINNESSANESEKES